MATVVFDFDSTLIDCESLEEILAQRLAARPELEHEIRAITALGMEGAISFADSLGRRLALAAPTLDDVIAFGHSAIQRLSPGVTELIGALRERGVAVKIISGGLREAILPVAQFLGLDSADVGAVALNFAADGRFLGIDPNDPFSISKSLGARALASDWSRPRIAVGDGMTDLRLQTDGIVDHFIAYTQWARRTAVLASGAPEAPDVATLTHLIQELL